MATRPDKSTRSATGVVDFSGATRTAPAKTGTSLPGTCTVGDMYFKSDSTAGQNLHLATATNTWTQVTSTALFDKGRVYRSGAVNTTNAGWQKITMDATQFDTASIWDTTNTRFIPTREGYYEVTVHFRTNTAHNMVAGIYKNGSIDSVVGGDLGAGTTSVLATGGTALIYCNGSSDYLEPYMYTTNARAVTPGAVDTYMSIVGPF